MVYLHDLCVQCLHVWCLPELSVAPWGARKPDLSTLYNFSLQLSSPLWCNSLSLVPLHFSPSSLVLLRMISTPPPPSCSPLLHLLPPSFFHSVFCLFIWLPLSFLLFSPKGNTIESEHLSELTEEEYEAHIYQRQDLKGFMWLDAKYLNPFFTRRLTQEVRERMQKTLILYCLKIHQPHFNDQFQEECDCQSGPYGERPQAQIKLLTWWRVGGVLVNN